MAKVHRINVNLITCILMQSKGSETEGITKALS